MENIEKAEKEFLFQKDSCPFCESELLAIHSREDVTTKEISSIYDYACSCQIKLDEETYTLGGGIKDTKKLTLLSCCSNKTTSLKTVLNLRHDLRDAEKQIRILTEQLKPQ